MYSKLHIRLAQTEAEEQVWRQFVDQRPESTNYHRWGWKHVIENSFHWRTFYLLAEDPNERCCHGILPLVWQKSRIFGTFLTSIPFLNAGGMIADGAGVKEQLFVRAIEIAKELGVDYLELRHRNDPYLNDSVKTHKVNGSPRQCF